MMMMMMMKMMMMMMMIQLHNLRLMETDAAMIMNTDQGV
jgi:hypothetical protein